MTRIELKLMVENNKLSFIDMDESLLTDISDENLQLLKNKHPLALNFLKEFGETGISKKIDVNMYQYFMVNNQFCEEYLISDSEILIARMNCGAQVRNVIYLNEHNCFKIENGPIIADNVENLFKYMMSEESILPIKILPDTLEKLQSFGWYEGRSIDISNITEKFQLCGTPLTNKQKHFLQEFGGIKGIDANDEEFLIYDSIRMSKCGRDNIVYFTNKVPSRKDMTSYGSLNIMAYNNNINMLRIGETGYGIMPIWISTDGKLFRDDGVQLGRTAIEGIQTIILGQ